MTSLNFNTVYFTVGAVVANAWFVPHRLYCSINVCPFLSETFPHVHDISLLFPSAWQFYCVAAGISHLNCYAKGNDTRDTIFVV